MESRSINGYVFTRDWIFFDSLDIGEEHSHLVEKIKKRDSLRDSPLNANSILSDIDPLEVEGLSESALIAYKELLTGVSIE